MPEAEAEGEAIQVEEDEESELCSFDRRRRNKRGARTLLGAPDIARSKESRRVELQELQAWYEDPQGEVDERGQGGR